MRLLDLFCCGGGCAMGYHRAGFSTIVGIDIETLFGDHGVMLCGSQFGLRIWRHRLFECSFPIRSPGSCRHKGHPLNPHREDSRERMRQEFGRVDLEKVWRKYAGLEWMNKHEGRQAIPPVFTEYIGKHLLDVLKVGPCRTGET